MTNEELVSAIQAGERERLAELWTQVERFVSIQADRRARQLNGYGGVTAEDLCQSGFLAMVEAADRYDAGSGKSFHGFLAFYLQSYFAEAAGYRTSRRDAVDFATGLDTPIPGTDDLTAADTVQDPGAAAAFDEAEQRIWLEQLHEALERALDQIPGEQSDILRRRFYAGQTLNAIGEEYGVGLEAIRQRERSGLRSMRQGQARRELKQFVDTPYYTGTGIASFRRSGSQPERLVILRENLGVR